MGKNAWQYLFAGISAAAGIAYLYQQRNAQPAQNVTNVLPALNTDQMAPTDDLGVLPTSGTDQTGITGAQQSHTKPYPVYNV